MVLREEVNEIYKFLKAKNLDISRENIAEILKGQSEIANHKLSAGEPVEFYQVGKITPKLFNGDSAIKKEKTGDGSYATFKFLFKIAPTIKKQTNERLSKI